MIKLRMFFSPHFLIKYYLLKDIIDVIQKYKFKGSVVDIGCGQKPYKKLFRYSGSYQGIDFKDYSKNTSFYGTRPDYFFDKKYSETSILPFNSDSFNHTVSFQVLEHHKNPQKLIEEIIRITKKGGLVLLSVPLIWGLHEKPNDYFRFTEYGIKELIKKYDCKILYLKRQGSIFSTISILLNDYWVQKMEEGKIFFYFAILFYPFSLLFSYSCLFLDKIFPSKEIFLNYLILLKKSSNL